MARTIFSVILQLYQKRNSNAGVSLREFLKFCETDFLQDVFGRLILNIFKLTKHSLFLFNIDEIQVLVASLQTEKNYL